VAWSPLNSPFKAGTKYTATIRLTAGDGSPFDKAALAATVNGSPAKVVSNNGKTATVSYTFPATGPELPTGTISHVNVDVVSPTVGLWQDTAATTDVSKKKEYVTWSPLDGDFKAGTRYTATVRLTYENNFAKDALTATINGFPAKVVSNNGKTATVSYTFPATGPELPTGTISHVDVIVASPIAGHAQDTMAISGGHYNVGAVAWSPLDDTFKAGTRYTATVRLTYGDFDKYALTVTVNDFPARIVANNGKDVTLTYTFDAVPE
jgi:uncharacterized membrane protein YjjB (DUF3815 family)